MLYQLRTTVNGVEFAALVSTEYKDLLHLPHMFTDPLLVPYYSLLQEQINTHLKEGDSAKFKYPWPMISIGFDRYQASNLFERWKEIRPMAYSEDRRSLIESPRQRKVMPAGRNLFQGLRPERRLGIHALMMVKKSKDHFSLN